MTLLTHEQFRELANTRGQSLISILQPLHRSAAETDADRITFKDLLFEVEKQLRARDLRTPEIEQRLAPMRALLDDSRFWVPGSQGLAVFLDDDNRLQTFRVPVTLSKRAYLGPRYYLEPLVELLREDGRIYILALSQRGVRLIEVSQSGHRLLEWEDLPAHLSQVMQAEAGPRPLHFHRAAPPIGEAPAQGLTKAVPGLDDVHREGTVRVRLRLQGHLAPGVASDGDRPVPRAGRREKRKENQRRRLHAPPP